MIIKLYIQPPTATAQEHKVKMINGHPQFYDPPNVKRAKAELRDLLHAYKPEAPFEGPVALTVNWVFRKGSHKPGWKTTRPDTDNLQKGLKDIMTDLGFWLDDAQVAMETVSKEWAKEPYLQINVRELI